MNILPKKKWHVRTRENVTRVRKDMKAAAEEAQRQEDRALLAEREHRARVLRMQADKRKLDAGYTLAPADTGDGAEGKGDGGEPAVKRPTGDYQTKSSNDVEIIGVDGHINLFMDLEREDKTVGGNKEHEKDMRKDKEDEERKIGLLKFLGEGSVEFEKVKPWYVSGDKRETTVQVKYRARGEHPRSEIPVFARQRTYAAEQAIVAPSSTRTIPIANGAPVFPSQIDPSRKRRHSAEDEDKNDRTKKSKKSHKKKKHKKRRASSSEVEEVGAQKISDATLEQLRQERLIREAAERTRAELLIRRAQGIKDPTPPPEPKRKYNSQFNPELARQNMADDDRGGGRQHRPEYQPHRR